MQPHKIVSHQDWLAARERHLKNEKALTRMRDMVAADRRELPWVKVEKQYAFETPEGTKTLSELFGNNSQLIVQHFMWREDQGAGCTGCSLHTDAAEGALVHLQNHDVSFVMVSRGPLGDLMAYKKRMGWTAPWVSSLGSDFNFDYHVSFTKDELATGEVYYNYRMTKDGFDELPGLSVFIKDDAGNIYHTYSSYARGNEDPIGVFAYLDMTPKGRNENEIMEWVKRHDEYGDDAAAACCHSAKSA